MAFDKQKVTLMWNQFIWLMEQTENQWGKIVSEVELSGSFSTDIQALPMQAQKGLAMFGKSKFLVMLPRFIDHLRRVGCLTDMKVDIKKEREDAGTGRKES